MKASITLVLMFALMATGLMAQPGPDMVVNDTYVVTPSYGSGPLGDLPDAEIGLSYDGARVFLKRPADYSSMQFQGVEINTTNPWPAGIVLPPPGYDKFFTGMPSGGAGTYYIWLRAVWLNTVTSVTSYSSWQGYQMQVRPYGYGVTYPPPPNSGGGGGGGGSDSSCSTVASAGLGVPTTLSAILGALFWRRRRRTNSCFRNAD